MKGLILLQIMTISLFCSCTHVQNYRYEWDIKVIYTNGESEILHESLDSFKGNKCALTIQTEGFGILSGSLPEPCLIKYCGFINERIACGVRRYEILKLEKLPIK